MKHGLETSVDVVSEMSESLKYRFCIINEIEVIGGKPPGFPCGIFHIGYIEMGGQIK